MFVIRMTFRPPMPGNSGMFGRAMVRNPGALPSGNPPTYDVKMGWARGVVGVVVGAFALSSTPAIAAQPHHDYVVVVHQLDAEQMSATVRALGGRVTGTFDALDFLAVRMPAHAAAAVQANPHLEVHVDAPVQLFTTASPPPSWGLDRIDQRTLPLSNSSTTPAHATGSGVTVYVVDSGIRTDHVEFTGRIDPGFSTVDGSPSDVEDCNGHGTHVSSTIAGTTYGVAPGARIVPVRVFGCGASTSTTAIITAMDWAVAQHVPGSAAVMNMSFGGPSTALVAAVDRVFAAGIVPVAAAGNETADACQTYPAGAARAVTVGSTTSTDRASSFSNFGSCVDIWAPGSGITAAWNTSARATATISGTSMAAPHVAGAAARYLSVFTAATPATVIDSLLRHATRDRLTNVSGSVNALLFADPLGPAEAPTAPRSVSAESTAPGTLTATWLAPASDGASAITSYTVTYSRLAGEPLRVSGVTALTHTASDLPGGAQYTVSVEAVNRIGAGPASTTASPVTVEWGDPTEPSSPLAPSITTSGNRAVTVAWVAPVSTGGSELSGYIVTLTDTSTEQVVTTRTVAPSSTSSRFTSLTAGISYQATITALNTIGTSSAAETGSVRAVTLSSSPTSQRLAVTGDRRLTANWVAPMSTGFTPITGYRVTLVSASTGAVVTTRTVAASARSTVFTSLSAGTSYRARVSAINAVGASSQATTSAIRAATRPGRVTSPKVSYPASLRTTLTWSAPTSTGFSPIIRYEVRHTTRAGTTSWSSWASTGTTRSRTISGIARGVTRYAEMRAVTAAGAGPALRVTITPTR
jgi:subtilisin family serine protease